MTKIGRPKDADLYKIRTSIEAMTLAGLSQSAIAGELAIHVRSVERHQKAIREGWLRESAADAKLLRAQLIAEARSVAKDAHSGVLLARRKGDQHAEAAMLNLKLRAQGQIAKLTGLTKAPVEVTVNTGGAPALVVGVLPEWTPDTDFARQVAIILQAAGEISPEADPDAIAPRLLAPVAETPVAGAPRQGSLGTDAASGRVPTPQP